MNNRVDITTRYLESEEVRVDDKPYLAYAECVRYTFDFNSFCDIGCATGHLIYFLSKDGITTKGYEYFDYHKQSPHCKIPDNIEIADIRDPLPDGCVKYNIVNCTEVGEHIDPEYADTLIENAKKLSSKYIIFTWSSHGGSAEPECDPHHQHLNPLSRQQYMELMTRHGLKANMELTERFLTKSHSLPDFYFWWRESFVIWEVQP
jgi:hypothetical protein